MYGTASYAPPPAMTTTATASLSTRRPAWSSNTQPRLPKSSAVPSHGRPAASVGQAQAPLLTPQLRTPSPNYFGLVVEPGANPNDSNAGGHAKKNWVAGSVSSRPSDLRSPLPMESNPEFESFRRQSETNIFTLGHGNLSSFSMGSGTGTGQLPTLGSLTNSASSAPQQRPGEENEQPAVRGGQDAMEVDCEGSASTSVPSFFDLPRTESPVNALLRERPPLSRNPLSHVDDRHPRLSLPQVRVGTPVESGGAKIHHGRADTLPPTLAIEGASMIIPQVLKDLLSKTLSTKVLLLDLRVSPQYAQSRLRGALNLCIPTTLLKRPSFNVQKLAETFTLEQEKAKFSCWMDVDYIVVYDASSLQLKDATSSVNTLKKFATEGFRGTSYILKGGFSEVSRRAPELVERQDAGDNDDSAGSNLSINAALAPSMPVAGGCPMPAQHTAAIPFFNNIRQNMDLIDGVGQISIKRPEEMSDKSMQSLPTWLREAADDADKGKRVADRFLGIEKAEQERMQKALTGHVQYGTPDAGPAQPVQIAGIERGSKNRYKDMLPYDHARVRLRNVSSDDCDYINASHIKAEWSYRHYIATQAPIPATFEDFWRLVWEQDARVVVMLTAESEGGQRKAHPYWLSNNYGSLKLKALSEKKVALEPAARSHLLASSQKPSCRTPTSERQPRSRSATIQHGLESDEAAARDAGSAPGGDVPHYIIRKLALSHSAYPFQPMREITQVQYNNWPDFGAPASCTDLLGLVEHCGSVIRGAEGAQPANARLPAPQGGRPVVVHCSAGCGRTGTFCTIDSVIDMLKRQIAVSQKQGRKLDSVDDRDLDYGDWIGRDDIDLVQKTVEDLRFQRLSMVQNLKQYVLCYESVLEWLVSEIPERFQRDNLRRISYAG